MSTEVTETELPVEELVWVEVIGEKPVDRVMKGGRLQMVKGNAEAFVKAELVKIVEVEPEAKPTKVAEAKGKPEPEVKPAKAAEAKI
jgi:hypothetical protein